MIVNLIIDWAAYGSQLQTPTCWAITSTGLEVGAYLVRTKGDNTSGLVSYLEANILQ